MSGVEFSTEDEANLALAMVTSMLVKLADDRKHAIARSRKELHAIHRSLEAIQVIARSVQPIAKPMKGKAQCQIHKVV